MMLIEFRGLYTLYGNFILNVSTDAIKYLFLILHFYLVSKMKVTNVYIAFPSRLKTEKLPSISFVFHQHCARKAIFTVQCS